MSINDSGMNFSRLKPRKATERSAVKRPSAPGPGYTTQGKLLGKTAWIPGGKPKPILPRL